MAQQLRSISPPLSQADLLTCLYSLAVIFSHKAERNRVAAQQRLTGDLKGLLADLKIRLEETFTFTVEQCVCQCRYRNDIHLQIDLPRLTFGAQCRMWSIRLHAHHSQLCILMLRWLNFSLRRFFEADVIPQGFFEQRAEYYEVSECIWESCTRETACVTD
jgi:hypothetical protein